MNIPDEAVEAAAKVLFQDSMSDQAGENVPEIAAACEAVMRKALEAAAPYIIRDAKADAWQEGRQSRHDHMIGKSPTNPYRSQA